MNVHSAAVRMVEEPDQRDWIPLEQIVIDDVDASSLNDEPGEPFLPLTDTRQAEARLPLELLLESRAEDAREVAHFLGDEIVMLHETFDAARTRAVRVPHAPSDPRLGVEGQPLLRAMRQIVQMAAHGPEIFFRLRETPELVLGQHPMTHEVGNPGNLKDVLADPEQGVQIAQTPFALLDVGFHDIARIAETFVAPVSLRELRLDEVGAR